MRFAIIGAGNRGRETYAKLLKEKGFELTAAVDTNADKIETVKNEFNLPDSRLYDDVDKFFNDLKKEKFTDILVIATPDRKHYDITLKALDFPVHILLEKPISPNEKEVREIAKKAQNRDYVFMICHVLRYAPFYRKIKRLLDDGEIGKIMTINHNENIGYYHFAHSFVRGNWNNEEKSSPLILQKSCHDMDILLFLTGKKPKSINSYGNLSYFKKENQPEGASERCIDCKYEKTCVFSAVEFYRSLPERGWRKVVSEKSGYEALIKALKTNSYGKCVWQSDNDVCDHQSVSIEFEDEISAVFNLSAFSNEIHRNIKIQGTKGEIIGDDLKEEIMLRHFGEDEIKVFKILDTSSGHGGGDEALIDAFVDAVNGDITKVKTGAKESVMSHIMCFASEKSRKENIRVNIDDYI
ncbi:MAG: Gfo/Idh/MocA family oxidoreductase [Peptoniphilaceae bacterium]|nr:Gfo/Idh/MocA family oxidoreductase [Peptoniphilaceae bacterium]MDY3738559.1 Gfo/Idh/MocA family oxidoreductase [Peptoniphilaceae bacterium]